MKFMINYEIHASKRQEVFSAFGAMALSDYQAQQGPNIKVIGRWHDVVNGRGVAICETTSAEAFSAWLIKWNAAVDFVVGVVHDDAEAHALVKTHLAVTA